MRIAMIMSYLPVHADRGGVSYQVHALANLLVERGHTVVVYSVDERPGDARYEVRTVPLPRWVRAESGLCHLVFPVLVARQGFDRFDVLHAHGDDFLLWWLGRPWWRRRPRLRTFYGSALGEALSATSWRRALVQALFYPLEFFSGALARRSVAISRATCRYLPFVREVVPCGVDLSRFSPGGYRSPVPSALFVGMMAGRKQGRRLAQIFAEQVRSQVPEAELWLVVPEPVDGPGLRWLGKVDPE
ncbi:MAG: glycosyltransferase family 4 protein, partial [Chloroflexi bacterium]|nr:glycosyltransferase family 4 protein [Chloroflexota bacterium]